MSPFYEKGVSPKGLHRLMPSTRVSGWCAHRVQAISEKVRLELIEHGVPSERIDTVYAPVDYTRFASAAEGDVRRELGLDPSHILITTVGHAFAVKGWDIALRAFTEVLHAIPNARLILVGGVDTCEEEKMCFQQLTGLSERLGVSEYVHFLGRRDDIPGILKACGVFILPSRSEGLPSALSEAMAAGLPCVAARVGGIPEVVTHGEDGLLFERENVDDLARLLVQLIQDKELRTALAARAANSARAFSMKGYVDTLFECYKDLIDCHLSRSHGC
jgi:glycosyltransferase involved in cell wall biosynthesis